MENIPGSPFLEKDFFRSMDLAAGSRISRGLIRVRKEVPTSVFEREACRALGFFYCGGRLGWDAVADDLGAEHKNGPTSYDVCAEKGESEVTRTTRGGRGVTRR